MFKMKRHEIKDVQKVINEYSQKTAPIVPMEMANGNTPSPLSPTSVGSQVSHLLSHFLVNAHCFKSMMLNQQ
jgi:hypothetical protein